MESIFLINLDMPLDFLYLGDEDRFQLLLISVYVFACSSSLFAVAIHFKMYLQPSFAIYPPVYVLAERSNPPCHLLCIV